MNREQAEQEVMQLADAWIAAELHGDTTFLEQTLAEDFIGIGPLGFLLTKQEWLGRHRSGEMKYTVHALDEIKVRGYDEAAILVGRLTQQATYRGNPMNTHMRTTLVFVRKAEQWHLAGLHFCNIGQPPPFARS
ncbi:MAG: nuclear transport factor 2 family protein [Ktedonobacteraceae bacterium]|nr:nuclear transport factor 2 family protein [Ktedonobacteraceae bacterium]